MLKVNNIETWYDLIRALHGISFDVFRNEILAVIGDNIANVNTVGFKSSRVEFESLLANLGNKIKIITINGKSRPAIGMRLPAGIGPLTQRGDGHFLLSHCSFPATGIAS